jgi:hypothetical protein
MPTIQIHKFVYVFCLFVSFGYSQDTIIKKDDGKLLVRVMEISDSATLYKLFYNPDGKIYSLSNQMIDKIIYENGFIEPKFNKTKSTDALQFRLEGKHLSYQNEDITHQNAFKLMLKKDPQRNSDELNSILTEAEIRKNKQVFFTILSPVCFIGGVYVARRNYYGPHTAKEAQIYLLSGVGFAIGSGIVAVINKSIKNKRIREAALLYNQELSY